MKSKIKVRQEVDVAFVDVTVPVRYGIEDIPADFPFRNGDTWSARIDVDAGTIVGWPSLTDRESAWKFGQKLQTQS